MRWPGWLLLALTISACGSKSVRSPGAATPALFASIPADTPYLIAGFEPVPFEAFATMWRAVEPIFGETLEGLRSASPVSSEDRVVDAVLRELDGKWSVAGLESLGLSARPRFALYGLGYQPTVLRVEIKDETAVLATLGRIAVRADMKLPPTETHEGRKFWRIPSGNRQIIVALLDRQLVVGFGAQADLDRSLSLILGSKKPANSMANDTVLAEVMARHRFDPYAIWLIDTKRLATAYLTHKGVVPETACTGALDRLTTQVPRVVGAYNISKARHAMVVSVELAPALVAKLEALKVEVPGLRAEIAAHRFATFGGGIDVLGAQRASVAVADSLQSLGAACDWLGLLETGTALEARVAHALPDPFYLIRGGFISVLTMSHEEPIPATLEGYAVVIATSMQPVFEFLTNLDVVTKLGVIADGNWHTFTDKLPLRLPYELSAAVGQRSLVLAVGAKGKDAASSAIDASGGDKVPFVISHYDYGRWLEIKSRRATTMESDVQRSLARVFGDADMILDVDKTGLTFEFAFELK